MKLGQMPSQSQYKAASHSIARLLSEDEHLAVTVIFIKKYTH